MQKTDNTMKESEKLFDKISLDRNTPLLGLLKYIPSEFLLQELLRRNQEQRVKEAREKYEELVADAVQCHGKVISVESFANDNGFKSVGIRLDDETVENLGIMSHQRTVHYQHMVMLIGPSFKVGDEVNLTLMKADFTKHWPPVILDAEVITDKN